MEDRQDIIGLANQAAELNAGSGRSVAEHFVKTHLPLKQAREALLDLNVVTRRKALFLLPLYGARETFNDLCRVLKSDASPVLKHEAAFLLGATGFKEAVILLTEAIENDPSDLVKHEAIEALGDLGFGDSVDTLVKLTAYRNDDVAETARIALAFVKAKAKTKDHRSGRTDYVSYSG